MITKKQIKDKLKNKDFTISYNDAIDLVEIMPIIYYWASEIGGPISELMYIQLSDYSDVKLHIRD